VGAKLEQDLSAAIRFQRLLERFLELVERVDMLHCGGERSISCEVFDANARRSRPVDPTQLQSTAWRTLLKNVELMSQYQDFGLPPPAAVAT
jgi:hypothetical protein